MDASKTNIGIREGGHAHGACTCGHIVSSPLAVGFLTQVVLKRIDHTILDVEIHIMQMARKSLRGRTNKNAIGALTGDTRDNGAH